MPASTAMATRADNRTFIVILLDCISSLESMGRLEYLGNFNYLCLSERKTYVAPPAGFLPRRILVGIAPAVANLRQTFKLKRRISRRYRCLALARRQMCRTLRNERPRWDFFVASRDRRAGRA